jgi:hypothetical protein
MLVQLVSTINYSAIDDSHTLLYTVAHTKSSMSSLGVAGQRLLSFRVQRLLSSLAGVYLTTHFHTETSVVSHVASNGGRSSASGLTSLQAGDHLKPTSDSLQTVFFLSYTCTCLRNRAYSSTRGGVCLSVEALRLLHRSFSTSISALSQRPGPYGHCAPFVTALF